VSQTRLYLLWNAQGIAAYIAEPKTDHSFWQGNSCKHRRLLVAAYTQTFFSHKFFAGMNVRVLSDLFILLKPVTYRSGHEQDSAVAPSNGNALPKDWGINIKDRNSCVHKIGHCLCLFASTPKSDKKCRSLHSKEMKNALHKETWAETVSKISYLQSTSTVFFFPVRVSTIFLDKMLSTRG